MRHPLPLEMAPPGISPGDESAHKLRAIVEGMVEGLVAVDRGERIIHLNSTAARLLGISEGQALGQRLKDTAVPEQLREALNQTLALEAPTGVEIRSRKGLKDRFVEVRASPIRDGQRNLLGAVALLHDVSKLRRLAAIRREFVANVSHELKTPITAIAGLIETLIDDPGMEETTRSQFLARARSQTSRLGSLVSDLLTITQLEASDQDRTLHEAIDLAPQLRSALTQLEANAEASKTALLLELDETPLMVLGDPESFRQIIDNLVINAIRYTPDGGRVVVRAWRQDAQVLIEVEDDGVGMESVHLERIFQRFYRVDQARSRTLGGTGLGLSIVKHRVQSLCGKVEVQSTPGEGSRFRITLPDAQHDQRETLEKRRMS